MPLSRRFSLSVLSCMVLVTFGLCLRCVLHLSTFVFSC